MQDWDLEGMTVDVLKDDGCNTNVVGKGFLARNAHLFDVQRCKFEVTHSKKGTTETASEDMNGSLRLGSHEYVSN